jgi:hypothetical protein
LISDRDIPAGSGRNPVHLSLKKNLCEVILRRFIDGMVEVGECGYGTWGVPLSYREMHMRSKNFNADEKIGADRTEECSGLLIGNL